MVLSDALISPVSQLQTQQVMTSQNKVTHRIFNTNLLYSCTHFVVEIEERSSHNGGFKYDLIMISDSGLRFLVHPVSVMPLPFTFNEIESKAVTGRSH